MKKSRDLQQAFDQLYKKISDFYESQTIDGLERSEIEGIIQQARLIFYN